MTGVSRRLVARAESSADVKAGIARLDDVLQAPSYRAAPDREGSTGLSEAVELPEWAGGAGSVLVLALHHPEDDPRLDWWDSGGSPGDRRLVAIAEALERWLEDEAGTRAWTLPYHIKGGGVFLKDAAVLAGLGIIGRNNLVVTPGWGPRIRLRAVLLEDEAAATGEVEGFSPCASCADLCQLACPREAFPDGAYHRPRCVEQMRADEANKTRDGAAGADGNRALVIKYCRACELACPVGAQDA